jgi:predicted PurR-regulated permease PerM
MRAQQDAPASRIPAADVIGRASASVLVGIGLLLVLSLRILAVLVCALVTHAVYSRLLQAFRSRLPGRSATAAALVLTFLVLVLLATAVWQAATVLSSPGGVPRLLDLLADALDRVRGSLPTWLSDRIPHSADDFTRVAGAWLRAHAQNLQRWGHAALRGAAHVLIGLVIGLLAAFERKPRAASAWGRAAAASLHNLVHAFRRVVSAQVRIAVVNTLLTAIYLFVVLPVVGIHLPLSGTLVAVTLLTGMLPIVGNLLSSAAIVLASLTVGPAVTVASIVFLFGIHKTEYFLNAHFVGHSTNVPAFCLLATMVALEAAFGVSGLIAAPIYCAWAFGELRQGGVMSLEPPH